MAHLGQSLVIAFACRYGFEFRVCHFDVLGTVLLSDILVRHFKNRVDQRLIKLLKEIGR